MAAEMGQGLEEVTESEMSFHHERPDSRRLRDRHTIDETNTTRDIFTPSLGIYGWRKRCLYFFLLLLLVIVIVNLGLTVWILVVLDFNVHGMGNLRITESGVRLQGRAEFTDTLYAQTIAADQDSSLLLLSQQSLNMSSGQSKLSLSPDVVTVDTPAFTVHTQSSAASAQQPVLSVSDQQVTIAADSLEAMGSLGVTVEGGVETSSLGSVVGGDLSVEAAGGKLAMVGGGGLSIEGGFTGGSEGVEISSYADLSLASQSGSVILSSSTIQLSGIPAVSSPAGEAVMEVCACASGRLFLVPASATQGCQDDDGICGA